MGTHNDTRTLKFNNFNSNSNNRVSLVFLGFAFFFFYFYNHTSSSSPLYNPKMADSQSVNSPKSIYDFTVKVFFFSFFSLFIRLLVLFFPFSYDMFGYRESEGRGVEKNNLNWLLDLIAGYPWK